jgi:hypothetical protein
MANAMDEFTDWINHANTLAQNQELPEEFRYFCQAAYDALSGILTQLAASKEQE